MFKPHDADEFDQLAEQAAKIATVLKKAARLAEKMEGKKYECELGTIDLRLGEIFKKSLKLGAAIEFEEEKLSRRKGATERAEEAHSRQKKKGA